MYGEHWFLVALTVAISLVGVVLWGTLSRRCCRSSCDACGFDPAASSAPFVATLVDVTGLVIYFSVAMVLLQETLLYEVQPALWLVTPDSGRRLVAAARPDAVVDAAGRDYAHCVQSRRARHCRP